VGSCELDRAINHINRNFTRCNYKNLIRADPTSFLAVDSNFGAKFEGEGQDLSNFWTGTCIQRIINFPLGRQLTELDHSFIYSSGALDHKCRGRRVEVDSGVGTKDQLKGEKLSSPLRLSNIPVYINLYVGHENYVKVEQSFMVEYPANQGVCFIGLPHVTRLTLAPGTAGGDYLVSIEVFLSSCNIGP